MFKANGLAMDIIRSGVELSYIKLTDNSYQGLLINLQEKFNDEGLAVVYLDYKILLGRWSEEKFVFYQDEIFQPKYLQKLRIFNEEREMLVWRKGEGNFSVRVRVDDNTGKEWEVVEAEQVLWGTRARELADGWSMIYEERGTELILPFDNFKMDNYKNRVRIKTRNYIGFNEMGQAGYVDSRFVKFVLRGEQDGEG